MSVVRCISLYNWPVRYPINKTQGGQTCYTPVVAPDEVNTYGMAAMVQLTVHTLQLVAN